MHICKICTAPNTVYIKDFKLDIFGFTKFKKVILLEVSNDKDTFLAQIFSCYTISDFI